MQYFLQTWLDSPANAVFAWHARPAALSRLIPPWERTRVLETGAAFTAGSSARLNVHLGPWSFEWLTEHVRVEPGSGFTDRQVRGPFSRWVHEHRFESCDGSGCCLTDSVDYSLPGGRMSELLLGGVINSRIDRAFRWRHRVTASDLRDLAEYGQSGGMDIAVTGSSGMIGSDLCKYLSAAGRRVRRLVRGQPRPGEDEFRWSPETGWIDPAGLEGTEAVVHLAGEGIAAGRWNEHRKQSILESRINGTYFLARTLAAMNHPPRVLVCASATGIYGDRGDEILDEDSSSGNGFLAGVCTRWETACAPAREAGIRVVNLRTGLVLTPAGGALRLMLLPFRLGLGGPLGRGEQYFGWITIDDLVRVILHLIARDDLSGPVITAAPEAVTNRQFSRTLAALLHRPACLRLPAAILHAVLGEMADELLLASQRVTPSRLLRSGFHFRYPRLATALAHLTGRMREPHIIK